MNFSEKLKTLRAEHRINQDVIATILEVGKSQIANYETGKSYPSVEGLLKLADHFNISTDELLCRKMIQNKNVVSEKDRTNAIDPSVEGFMNLIERLTEEKLQYKRELEECRQKNRSLRDSDQPLFTN